MAPQALILQNAAGEDHGILGPLLNERGWGQQVIPLYKGAAMPGNWNDFDLLLVMGGPMNVYEEETCPYLARETQVLKEALASGPPVMGFCLGAQLMAKACGAGVRKGAEKEIGWYEVNLTDAGRADSLLNAFPESWTVFQWHGDTFDIPEGAVRLFTSGNIPNQAMRIGEMNYGFQFHFEVTRKMIAQWLESGREELDSLGIKGSARRILSRADHMLPPLHKQAQIFFKRYLERVERMPR